MLRIKNLVAICSLVAGIAFSQMSVQAEGQNPGPGVGVVAPNVAPTDAQKAAQVKKIVGVFLMVKGSVEVVDPDSKVTRPGDAKGKIYLGDQVHTGKDGFAQVALLDGSFIKMLSMSDLEVVECQESGDKPIMHVKSTGGAISLLAGKITEENPKGYYLEVPSATIGIRGSLVEFVQEGDVSHIQPISHLDENGKKKESYIAIYPKAAQKDGKSAFKTELMPEGMVAQNISEEMGMEGLVAQVDGGATGGPAPAAGANPTGGSAPGANPNSVGNLANTPPAVMGGSDKPGVFTMAVGSSNVGVNPPPAGGSIGAAAAGGRGQGSLSGAPPVSPPKEAGNQLQVENKKNGGSDNPATAGNKPAASAAASGAKPAPPSGPTSASGSTSAPAQGPAATQTQATSSDGSQNPTSSQGPAAGPVQGNTPDASQTAASPVEVPVALAQNLVANAAQQAVATAQTQSQSAKSDGQIQALYAQAEVLLEGLDGIEFFNDRLNHLAASNFPAAPLAPISSLFSTGIPLQLTPNGPEVNYTSARQFQNDFPMSPVQALAALGAIQTQMKVFAPQATSMSSAVAAKYQEFSTVCNQMIYSTTIPNLPTIGQLIDNEAYWNNLYASYCQQLHDLNSHQIAAENAIQSLLSPSMGEASLPGMAPNTTPGALPTDPIKNQFFSWVQQATNALGNTCIPHLPSPPNDLLGSNLDQTVRANLATQFNTTIQQVRTELTTANTFLNLQSAVNAIAIPSTMPVIDPNAFAAVTGSWDNGAAQTLLSNINTVQTIGSQLNALTIPSQPAVPAASPLLGSINGAISALTQKVTQKQLQWGAIPAAVLESGIEAANAYLHDQITFGTVAPSGPVQLRPSLFPESYPGFSWIQKVVPPNTVPVNGAGGMMVVQEPVLLYLEQNGNETFYARDTLNANLLAQGVAPQVGHYSMSPSPMVLKNYTVTADPALHAVSTPALLPAWVSPTETVPEVNFICCNGQALAQFPAGIAPTGSDRDFMVIADVGGEIGAQWFLPTSFPSEMQIQPVAAHANGIMAADGWKFYGPNCDLVMMQNATDSPENFRLMALQDEVVPARILPGGTYSGIVQGLQGTTSSNPNLPGTTLTTYSPLTTNLGLTVTPWTAAVAGNTAITGDHVSNVSAPAFTTDPDNLFIPLAAGMNEASLLPTNSFFHAHPIPQTVVNAFAPNNAPAVWGSMNIASANTVAPLNHQLVAFYQGAPASAQANVSNASYSGDAQVRAYLSAANQPLELSAFKGKVDLKISADGTKANAMVFLEPSQEVMAINPVPHGGGKVILFQGLAYDAATNSYKWQSSGATPTQVFQFEKGNPNVAYTIQAPTIQANLVGNSAQGIALSMNYTATDTPQAIAYQDVANYYTALQNSLNTIFGTVAAGEIGQGFNFLKTAYDDAFNQLENFFATGNTASNLPSLEQLNSELAAADAQLQTLLTEPSTTSDQSLQRQAVNIAKQIMAKTDTALMAITSSINGLVNPNATPDQSRLKPNQDVMTIVNEVTNHLPDSFTGGIQPTSIRQTFINELTQSPNLLAGSASAYSLASSTLVTPQASDPAFGIIGTGLPGDYASYTGALSSSDLQQAFTAPGPSGANAPGRHNALAGYQAQIPMMQQRLNAISQVVQRLQTAATMVMNQGNLSAITTVGASSGFQVGVDKIIPNQGIGLKVASADPAIVIRTGDSSLNNFQEIDLPPVNIGSSTTYGAAYNTLMAPQNNPTMLTQNLVGGTDLNNNPITGAIGYLQEIEAAVAGLNNVVTTLHSQMILSPSVAPFTPTGMGVVSGLDQAPVSYTQVTANFNQLNVKATALEAAVNSLLAVWTPADAGTPNQSVQPPLQELRSACNGLSSMVSQWYSSASSLYGSPNIASDPLYQALQTFQMSLSPPGNALPLLGTTEATFNSLVAYQNQLARLQQALVQAKGTGSTELTTILQNLIALTPPPCPTLPPQTQTDWTAFQTAIAASFNVAADAAGNVTAGSVIAIETALNATAQWIQAWDQAVTRSGIAPTASVAVARTALPLDISVPENAASMGGASSGAAQTMANCYATFNTALDEWVQPGAAAETVHYYGVGLAGALPLATTPWTGQFIGLQVPNPSNSHTPANVPAPLLNQRGVVFTPTNAPGTGDIFLNEYAYLFKGTQQLSFVDSSLAMNPVSVLDPTQGTPSYQILSLSGRQYQHLQLVGITATNTAQEISGYAWLNDGALTQISNIDAFKASLREKYGMDQINYCGQATGLMREQSTWTPLYGSSQLSYSIANNLISGQLQFPQTSISLQPTAPNYSSAGLPFNGTANWNGTNGTYAGNFYGPLAQEVMGQVQVGNATATQELHAQFGAKSQ